jgi:hypothetical protein
MDIYIILSFKKQNDLLWTFYEMADNLSNDELLKLQTYNKQTMVHSNRSNVSITNPKKI